MRTAGRTLEREVIVVGSGSAGCVAAAAAARHGARTLLIERNTFLGGTSTAVLDTFYAFYTAGEEPLQVVGGVAQEVLDGLWRRGASFTRPNTFGSGLGVTYNPEVLAIVWDELLARSGVEVFTGALALEAVEDESGVTLLLAAKGAGLLECRAQVVIDASGDGDVAVAAGAKPLNDNELLQPATLTFRVGNVDTARGFPAAGRRPLREYVEEARRDGYALAHASGSMHRTAVPGCVLVAITRVASPAPDDPMSWSAAQLEARGQVEESVQFLRQRVPGFEEAALVGIAPMLGVRETRRIEGVHVLTEDEVLRAVVPADTIALCGAPIEDLAYEPTRWQHIPPPGVYGIPLGCLQPAGLECILVAGRCHSATHGAHSSARSMGTCMALGHAAGIAAALAIGGGRTTSEANAEAVREQLLGDGAVLELVR